MNGRTIGDLLLYPPENRMDRETALSMYTTVGAQLTGEGQVKGRVREGYYANLDVLEADYFCVPEDEISRIESVLLVVEPCGALRRLPALAVRGARCRERFTSRSTALMKSVHRGGNRAS